MVASSLGFILLFGLAGSGNDFFDYLPLDDFWKSQQITVSAESMRSILVDEPRETDVSGLIAKLGSEKFADREKAYSELKSAGGAILSQLTKAAEATDDVEVRQRLKQLIDSINQVNADRDTLQMAALRTIQDRKFREALPEVRKLVDSPNVMIAEYARSALAALEGKPFKRATPTPAMLEADLALLPADVGTVAQVRPPTVNSDDVFKPFKAFAGLGLGGGGADIEAKMKEAIVKAALRVGNVRVESMTLGVSNEVGRRKGYVVMVFRGYYSPAALVKVIQEENRRTRMSTIDGVEVWYPDDEFAIICLSSKRLVMIGGPSGDALPIAEVIKSLKAAPAKPSFSGDIVKLLAKVDRTKLAWVVSHMNDTFREAEFLKPFDWIVGEADQDAKGAINISFRGEGRDADAIGKVIDDANRELAKNIAQMEKFGAAMPMMAPMIKVMKSIKLESTGTEATSTLQIDDAGSLLMVPLMWTGFGYDAGPVEVAPAIEEAKPLEFEIPAEP